MFFFLAPLIAEVVCCATCASAVSAAVTITAAVKTAEAILEDPETGIRNEVKDTIVEEAAKIAVSTLL